MTEACAPTVNTGLRGVTVASTKISDVIGDQGKLIYRGFLVSDLAKNTCFEEIVHLLLFEKLPTAEELTALKQKLTAERAVPDALIEALKTRPADALPMDILQAAVPMLANHDSDVTDTSQEAALRMAIRLVAKLPTVLAAWERIRKGLAPVSPDPELDHSANFLYMLFGKPADSETVRFFDTGLVLHAEHSFNASTFAAREVASTRAHMYAAVSAAIGSLSGELHGGANVRVMRMLLDIGSPDKAEAYVNRVLDEGKKIMGLGHAVYKTDDPRAHILAPMSKRAGELAGDTRWYEISKILEEKGKKAFKERKGTDIYVNVDFYSASLYYSMGIPVDLYSPLFAISRVAGWTAHVIEEQFAGAAPKPMLYRPESKYIGEYCGPEECRFVPMDQR
ncbi:citrate/2-methylcitrate synthase [Desulfatitalea alkaliphila]|uniref:Citrate synthase n=1 Tax=Desulfatitalea alkaliphila TaxID=2929485 RepID=A0AA41R2Q3_9BACT|nr:citrate/2-methylcitrate synthase [Desulfatitalea alkaliphila]MCJ8500977.1 citrate (Si)-synthase [Desulfatitalea alkaliphila]